MGIFCGVTVHSEVSIGSGDSGEIIVSLGGAIDGTADGTVGVCSTVGSAGLVSSLVVVSGCGVIVGRTGGGGKEVDGATTADGVGPGDVLGTTGGAEMGGC